VSGDGGTHLWTSDGTAAGTLPLESRESSPDSLTPFGGGVVFVATDPSHGRELWASDGTVVGTNLVEDINPGPADSGIYEFAVLGDALYFTADDGVHGFELWKTDGTAQGTRLVVDLASGPAGAGIYGLTAIGNRLFFFAHAVDPAKPYGLWTSDGTAAGTAFVQAFATERYTIGRFSYDVAPGSLADLNGVAHFYASDGTTGRELWRSDGTRAGTSLVRDIRPGPASGCLISRELTQFDAELLFTADDGMNGLEPWATDGTGDGTSLVADIAPGPASSNVDFLTATPRTVLFSASAGVNSGAELWRTDGTPAAPLSFATSGREARARIRLP